MEELKKIELTDEAIKLLTMSIKNHMSWYEKRIPLFAKQSTKDHCWEQIGKLQTLLNYLKSI